MPFRVGEEVLVEIVEPHMYAADDAVAKIDGYIISVRGGGRARRPEADGPDRGGRPHRGGGRSDRCAAAARGRGRR